MSTSVDPQRASRAIRVAFAAAFTVLGFEVLAHRQLLYVSQTLEATTILSIAIMGIAAGGIAAFYTRNLDGEKVNSAAALGLAAGVLLNFLSFPFLGEYLVYAIPLLIVPFAAGGLLIAQSFIVGDTSKVYMFDLIGASLGAVGTASLLPWIGEEGAQAVLAAFALCVPFIAGSSLWRVSAGLAFACLAFAFANLDLSLYNIATDTAAHQRTKRKLFNKLAKYRDVTLLHSASSIAGRSDIVTYHKRKDSPRFSFTVWENGNTTDTLRPWGLEAYRWDPRIPPNTVMGPDVDTFIIGTSGEGVLKSARLTGGVVHGVEINPAVHRLVSGPASEYCLGCYDDVEVTIGDGRTFLERTDHVYDQITMMNSHIGRGTSGGREADPEFIHTKEAVSLYLDRLSDRGIINWEEPARSNSSHRVTARLISTAMAALQERGATDPAAHILVFEWSGSSSYDQLLVRKTPWPDDALEAARDWFERLPKVQPGVNGPIRCDIQVLWSPDERDLDTRIAKHVRGEKSGWPDIVRQPVTDDKPFPFDVTTYHDDLNTALALVLGLSTVLVLIPLGLILWRSKVQRVQLVAPIVVSGLLGLGYLLIEVVFMQQLQILLGSPVFSFVLVLGGMLAFSGIGGLLARPGRGFWTAGLVALPILLAVQVVAIPVVSAMALQAPLAARVAVALAIVAPCSLLMGIPLPSVMALAKDRFGDEFAALLYGINGGLAAFGLLLTYHISIRFGFSAAYLFGCFLYLGATGILLVFYRRGNS